MERESHTQHSTPIEIYNRKKERKKEREKGQEDLFMFGLVYFL
jgi:hypothetical protein